MVAQGVFCVKAVPRTDCMWLCH